MTLLEIMMVVAILALLVVAMVVYLLPSDDRRVRMEAERMAAYLQSAGAEAVMRDGPVRVAFDFGEQTYDREVARVGADIRAQPFEDDPGAERNRMREPVRLTQVLLPAMGDVSSGSAWMLWKGRDTEGGVAVLELNEAVWSVVVDPNNGDVRAERGRATLPVRGPGLGRSPFARGMPGLGGASGDMSADDVLAGLGRAIAEATPPIGGPGDPPRDGVPEDGDEPAIDPDDPLDGVPGDVPNPNNPPSEPEPPDFDAGVDEPDAEAEPDAGPKCTRDDECQQLEVCDTNAGECVYDPRRQEYRLTTVQVMSNAPGDLKTFLNKALQIAVESNQFNLIVKVDGFAGGAGPTESQPVRAWIAQGQLGNAPGDLPSYAVQAYLPTLMAFGTPSGPPCAMNGEHCYLLQAFDATEANKLRMWIPTPTEIDGCRYQQFTLVATVRLELRNDPAGRYPKGHLVVEGVIPRKDAEKYLFNYGGSLRSLAEVFDQFNYAPDADSNNDDEYDAWRLSFGGEVSSVRLQGQPASSIGVTPPGCKGGN
jgi:hypothetical protein